MREAGRPWTAVWTVLAVAALLTAAAAEDRVLIGSKERVEQTAGDNRVHQREVTFGVNDPVFGNLRSGRAGALPDLSSALDLDTTIHVLVLRFNFQYESTDDPNTTGRGHMNLGPHPLPGPYSGATPEDSIAYLDSVGHFIDPPPHDSVYFDAHMRAMNNYWEHVSAGKIRLTWDIFPPGRDSVYQLPQPMSYYGKCDFDSVILGLEYYFSDCIDIADHAHITDPGHPDIDFSQYGAIILFHAGSDRQNDIGFPVTCSDLYTGFIKFGRPIAVDNGATRVGTALMMPETSCQDNRATAINAVMVHEFGHQLGLPDLYRTDNFMSQLGDFALMDNNGFGTGVDFGFPVGQVFGTVPLYPTAWSRAYLGIDPVLDIRDGDDVRLTAAEVVSSGLKIARVPVSENEYYLIENRDDDFFPDIDNLQPLLLDSATNVILGPVDSTRTFTGEYDALMPGAGMLIYLVDEAVAAMDWDLDGYNNFDDNQLQNNAERRFIRLMEADGLVNFGGFYRAGWGDPEDMFRDDRATSFTPNTVPPAVDNTGNDTHVYVTDIRRDSVLLDPGMDPFRIDTVMFFDVAVDKLSTGFPVRAGVPSYGLAPVADDLDGDGTDEIIVASGDLLSVMTTDGRNFLREFTGCTTCPDYQDSALSQVNRRNVTVPLYVQTRRVITAGPVTGEFANLPDYRFVVVGYEVPGGGEIALYMGEDSDYDGQADVIDPLSVSGIPLALSFGDVLWVLVDDGTVWRKDGFLTASDSWSLDDGMDRFYGISRLGEDLVVLAGDSLQTLVYCVTDTVYSYVLDGQYQYGPITVDVDRNGQPEVAAFGADGEAVLVTVDTTNFSPSFQVMAERDFDYEFTVNPAAGDLDGDGYPELVIGGRNAVYAFNRELTLATDFPLEVDRRYPDFRVTESPVIGDLDRGGAPELVFGTEVGNIYSYGLDETFGFPLSAGELGAGPVVLFEDSTGGKLGYLGLDGWFYAWDVDRDVSGFWPMGGHDPYGSYAFDQETLGPLQPLAEGLSDERFYAYPNPVLDGQTTIRYYLGQEASEVTLTLYDLSGYEVTSFSGPVSGGVDNEVEWNCSDVTPGVYRCMISVNFAGDTQETFTDIAVIR